MSSLTRTFKNARKIGLYAYAHQMQTIGDTKYGRVVGVDRLVFFAKKTYGNTYYENIQEAPKKDRTRWVDYRSSQYDASHVEPECLTRKNDFRHAWMRHMVDDPPSEDVSLKKDLSQDTNGYFSRKKPFQPNLTLSRSAYKPYSTVLPSFSAWTPVTKRKF
ncbi:hypothetical protein PORY_002339 [Pneumocystis oryctolagi]|uniref:Uncharacterized protein n=1 Tax=Pneumocystis oryctolagi TaxID=42067 RepID=A0ACB7CC12_9ASCO|nr:hypothetical protein PORY_002339 [Pneumocystis oryctolagi]